MASFLSFTLKNPLGAPLRGDGALAVVEAATSWRSNIRRGEGHHEFVAH